MSNIGPPVSSLIGSRDSFSARALLMVSINVHLDWHGRHAALFCVCPGRRWIQEDEPAAQLRSTWRSDGDLVSDAV